MTNASNTSLTVPPCARRIRCTSARSSRDITTRRGRVDAVSTGEFSVGGRVFISTDEAMSNVSLIPRSDGIDGIIDLDGCAGTSGMDSRDGSNS